MNEVKEIYENYNELDRLLRHKTEFYINNRFIKENLPSGKVRILDLGGGVGRYSIELSKLGHQVTLIDLSEKNIWDAKNLSKDMGVEIYRAETGNALDLSRFDNDSFDIVLAMGPFYHIKDQADRVRCLEEIKRVLKQKGTLFTAHLTKYAFFKYVISQFPERIDSYAENFRQVFKTGVKKRSDGDRFTDNTYCENVEDLTKFLTDHSFDDIKVIASEGLADLVEERINQLDDEKFEKVSDLNYMVASDPYILNSASHLLAKSINRK